QKPARSGLVPRLRALSREIRQRAGVRRRFLGELQRHFLRVCLAALPVQVEVAFDLLTFLPEQERQQVAGPKTAAEPGAQACVERRLRVSDLIAILGEQLA